MVREEMVKTAQEIWHNGEMLQNDKKRERAARIYKKIRNCPVTADLHRARLFTESFKETEGQEIHIRWAKAMMKIACNIPVLIDEDDVIVGKTVAKMGRYAMIFPELEGPSLLDLETAGTRESSPIQISPDDLKILKEEIYPYWKDKSLAQYFAGCLPAETRKLLYGDYPNSINPISTLIGQTATTRSTLNFNFNYGDIINTGIDALKKSITDKMAEIIDEPCLVVEKMSFLEAAEISLEAFTIFIERYAEEALRLIDDTKSEERKKELQEISDICSWIAHKPARTFKEALQLHWFIVAFACLEQKISAALGNGRTDQHLYPFYKKDIEEGRLTREEAKSLFEYFWLNLAQIPFVPLANSSSKSFEAYSHFESVTIGGQTPDGDDATNELSYVILESKRGFPLPYPDLAVRIHSRTPDKFLKACCEVIKDGQGFPKLLNDEEIIPLYVAKGATLEQAYDYACSGCTEVRIFDRETYVVGGGSINLGAILETVMYNGRVKLRGNRLIGLETGDPRGFKKYEDFLNAVKLQLENALKNIIIQQMVAEKVHAKYLASPFCSVLTKACREEAKDIHQFVPNSFREANVNLIGYATFINSVVAVKKVIFEEKQFSMDELIVALENNFENNEVMRQILLNAPKYGNNDKYADAVGKELDNFIQSYLAKHRGTHGDIYSTRVIPITAHIPYGRITRATPDGRLAGEPLSEGTAGSPGTENGGPTALLLSNKNVKNERYTERAARLLNIKFTPNMVQGEEGTKKMISFIRTWCDLKLWHVQFNIINKETLVRAQQEPDQYRDLIIRVAGYSAYFTEMTPTLQNEIINRYEHEL